VQGLKLKASTADLGEADLAALDALLSESNLSALPRSNAQAAR
jgi:outer membrane protein